MTNFLGRGRGGSLRFRVPRGAAPAHTSATAKRAKKAATVTPTTKPSTAPTTKRTTTKPSVSPAVAQRQQRHDSETLDRAARWRARLATAGEESVSPTPPSAIARLTAGRLACPSCGVAVLDTPDASGERVTLREVGPVEDRRTSWGEPMGRARADVDYLRCPPCQERAGQPALDALAAAGLPLPGTVGPALVRHLGPLGGSVAWSADPASHRGNSAAVPWAHVTPEIKARIRAAYAAMLAERADRHAPDVRVSAPEGGGCGFCGVAAVEVPARQVRELGGLQAAQRSIWTQRQLPLGALGGRRSPRPAPGWLCPSCEDAVTVVGSIGPTAMEKALADHLAASGHPDRAALVRTQGTEGLVGWAVLRDGEEPNAEPWGHIDTKA